MRAKLQSKLRHLVVDMLGKAHICIDVVDVDAPHGKLGFANSLQTFLRNETVVTAQTAEFAEDWS